MLLSFLVVLLFCIQLFLLYRVFSYRNMINEKNIRLIKSYLNTKFVAKSLGENVMIDDSIKFCSYFIKNIKEYYDLQDLFIIDSVRMSNHGINNEIRRVTIDSILNNLNILERRFSVLNLSTITIKIKGKSFVVYISPINSCLGDGLIVCVENSPSFLTKEELYNLENCISLLKTRLLFQ